MRIKKVFVFILLVIVGSFFGLYGCGNKYANMTVELNKQEITVYLNEEEDTDTFVATVSGVKDDVSLDVNYIQSNPNVVSIQKSTVNENGETTFTVTALSGGHTDITVVTKEGDKRATVGVDVVERVTAMNYNTSYTPYVVAGNQAVINTAQAVLFTPSTTTQKNITYSLKGQTQGVSITSQGLISTDETTIANEFTVIATNTDADFSVEIPVKIIHAIDETDIQITSNGVTQNLITLVTNRTEESSIDLDIDVNTQENITISYSVSNTNVVELSKLNDQEINLQSGISGTATLTVTVSVVGYPNYKAIKNITVNVIELPNYVSANGISTNQSLEIYDNYSNILGQKLTLQVGPVGAYDKRIKLGLDSADRNKITVTYADGTPVDIDNDILDNNTVIYVKAKTVDTTVDLHISAYGGIGYSNKAEVDLTLTTKLGATGISPTLDNSIAQNTLFVEKGKSTTLNYSTANVNASTKNLSLDITNSSIANSTIINSDLSTIVVNGLSVGSTTAKLVLANGVESSTFNIVVFSSANSVVLTTDSPNDNRYVANVEYDSFNTLSSFVLALGSGVNVNIVTNPSSATIFSKDFSVSAISESQNESAISVSSTGYVVARSTGEATLNVNVTTLVQNDDGTVSAVLKNFAVTVKVIVQISNVNLNTTSSTIYFKDNLNYYDFNAQKFLQQLTLKMTPSSAYYDSISWTSSNPNLLQVDDNGLVTASYGANEPTQTNNTVTITAIVQSYSKVFTVRCTFNVVKSVKATSLTLTNVFNSQIYFNSRDGLLTNYSSGYEGTDYPVTQMENSFTINSQVTPTTATNKNIKYQIVEDELKSNPTIVITKDGTIYPVSAGTCTLKVFLEDWRNQNGNIANYKEIKIVVADGLTEETAFNISNEAQFKTMLLSGNDYFYSLENDIYLTSPITTKPDTFTKSFNGNKYTVYNLSVSNGALIGTEQNYSLFSQNEGIIKNLNIQLNYNATVLNNESNYSGFVAINNGTIENCNLYINNFNISSSVANAVLKIGGLAVVNNGEILSSAVNGNINLNSASVIESNVIIGGLVANNTGKIYGNSNNYFYQTNSSNQISQFNYSGAITATGTVNNSSVGGIAGANSGTIGSLNAGIVKGKGVAVDVLINTPNFTNVGGVVGYNNGTVQNTYSIPQITALSNVGGVVGYNEQLADTENSGILNLNIVEIFEKLNSTQTNYTVINGQNYVGGLVGFVTANSINGSIILNNYVKSYDNYASIFGNDNVGGLVGYINNAIIETSSADINTSSNQTVGGLVGKMENSQISNAYSRGIILNGTTVGAISGIATNSIIDKTYSTILDTQIVGIETSNTVTNSYREVTIVSGADETEKTVQDLKDISTYTNFDISTEFNYSTWYITVFDSGVATNAEYNDGYPVLCYESSAMNKQVPSTLTIQVLENSNVIKVNDDLIILYTNEDYILSDIISAYTNVSENVTAKVTSSNLQILSGLGNDGLIVTGVTKLFSITEQSVTLTIYATSNLNAYDTIQIAFVNPANDFSLSSYNINIKKGASKSIDVTYLFNGEVTTLSNNLFVGVYSQLNSINSAFTINSSLNENGIYYINSNQIILSTINTDAETLELNLFKRISYLDESNNIQYAFVQLNSVTQGVYLEINEGAESLTASTTTIDLTLLDSIIFDVYLVTDNTQDSIYALPDETTDGDGIHYIKNNNQNYTLSGDEKLQLTLLDSQSVGNRTYRYTYELKFLDKFTNLTDTEQFNKAFNTMLTFVALSDSTVKTTVNIGATPQSLLKIDLTNFPAGQTKVVDGVREYYPNELPSNTLTPGQVGLMQIDLYPAYANFDELEITSTTDSNGEYISFVQIGLVQDENNFDNNMFLEIKPNSSMVTHGIIIQKVSTLTKNGSLYDKAYNGTIYLKTIIGSNAVTGDYITVTITGYNFVDGVKTQTIQKQVKLLISAMPGINISVNDSNKNTVVVQGEEMLAVAVGTTTKIDEVITDFAGSADYSVLVTYQGQTVENSNVTVIENELFVPYLTPAGTKILVTASVSRFINGVEESSTSTLIFYAVDFIIKGVSVTDANNYVLNIYNGTAQTINASLITSHVSNLNNIDEYAILNSMPLSERTADENALLLKYEAKFNLINEEILQLENLISNKIIIGTVNGAENQQLSNNVSDFWYDSSTQDVLESWQIGNTYNNVYEISGDNNIVITGKSVGLYESCQLEFKLSYGYTESGNWLTIINSTATNRATYEFVVNESNIEWIEGSNDQTGRIISNNFNLNIVSSASVDHPNPINNETEFLNMQAGIDYILMSNLNFTTGGYENYSFTPITTEINSLDGNGKTITINAINTADLASADGVGLFGTVGANTVLKNVKLVVSGTMTVDLTKVLNASFGLLAGINNGTITNSEVSFANYNNSNTLNINVLTDSSYTIYSGGFVGVNNGYITHSRIDGRLNSSNEDYFVTLNSNKYVAGFVCENNSVISDSFVKNFGVYNTSSSITGTGTAGFVYINSANSSINYSYIEGKINSNINNNSNELRALTENSATVFSLGNIGGFIYTNYGVITDSYSNIPLKTQGRSAGFVYQNLGSANVLKSYSLSENIETENSNAHTGFTGTNNLGIYLNASTATIKYSYYMSNVDLEDEDAQFTEPASSITTTDFIDDTSFIGFNITEENYGIWSMIGGRLTLNGANDIAVSIREIASEDSDNNSTTTDYNYISSHLGTENNPYLVYNAEQFLTAFTDPYYLTTINGITYNYSHIRIIKNIDLTSIIGNAGLNDLQNIVFTGSIDGGGMKISNLRILGNVNATDSFGLFKQVGTPDTQDEFGNTVHTITVIKNLTIGVVEMAQSTSKAVGILSGEVVNTSLLNLTISGNGITVLGKNMVGGIAGRISGTSDLYNTKSNVSVSAGYYKYPDTTKYSQSLSANNYTNGTSNISYAGGIAGVLDIDSILSTLPDYTEETDLASNVNQAYVYGSVKIFGENVGGLFGYTSLDTVIYNSQFEISTNQNAQNLAGLYTAGGLVGENHGLIELSKIEVINSNATTTDNQATNTTPETVFVNSNTHPVFVGGLVGINYGGAIINSYSKINVINYDADYVGGIVGYATNYTYGTETRYTYLNSVYTTGNVFAGSNYTTNDTGTTRYYSANNLAGGVFGLLEVTDQEIGTADGTLVYIQNVVGANALKKPTSYSTTLSNNYYDIANGFTVMTEIDSQDVTQTYSSTIGAFAGKIIGSSLSGNVYTLTSGAVTVEFGNGIGISNAFVNNYIFNGITIVSGSTGSTINFVAGGTIGILQNEINISELQRFGIDNATISSSNLLFEYRNNYEIKSTIYPFEADGWDNTTWEYENTVFPVLILRPTQSVVEIWTETDLDKLRTGTNKTYKLMADIYLTQNWEPINSFIGTLTSASRTDGKSGLNNNGYYTIYNINIDYNSTSTVPNVGFIANMENGTIKNIGLVFGGRIDENENILSWTNYTNGVNVTLIGNSVNKASIGSVVGYSSKSTIKNVAIKFAQDDANQTANINVIGDSMSTINIAELDVGGVVGYAKNNKFELVRVDSTNSTGKFEINFEARNTYQTVYVGGFVGNMQGQIGSLTDISILTDINQVKDSNTSNSFSPTTKYVGGLTGLSNAVSFENSSYYGSIFVQSNISASQSYDMIVGGLFGELTNSAEALTNCEVLSGSQIQIGNALNQNIIAGGAIGLINSSKLQESTSSVLSVIVTNVTIDAGGITGIGNMGVIGGIVGSVESGSNIFNAKAENISILYKNIGTENVFIGGAFGRDYVNSLLQGSTTLSQIGVTGNISIDSNSTIGNNQNLGGFIGSFIELENGISANDYKNRHSISKSFANVNILLNNSQSNAGRILSSNAKVGGFVGNTLSGNTSDTAHSIADCFTIGSIYTNSNDYYLGYLGGFVGYSNILMTRSYTLSTIKVTDLYPTQTLIRTTSKINPVVGGGNYTNDGIYYNSNSTGVVTYSQNIIGTNLSNVSAFKTKFSSSNEYGNWNTTSTVYPILNTLSSLNNLLNTTSGSKLNPISITNSNIATISVDVNKSYYLSENLTAIRTTPLINSTYYGTFNGNGYTINSSADYLFNGISSLGLVSGLQVNVSGLITDNYCPVATNNYGLIFNTLVAGTKTINSGYDKTISGMVYYNAGYIVNSGSKLVINSTNSTDAFVGTLVGLSYYNDNRISYSFVTGEINSYLNGAVVSGFAQTNSNTGIIYGSYTALFVDKMKSSNSTINAFVNSNIGTIKFSYYDKYSISSGTTINGVTSVETNNLYASDSNYVFKNSNVYSNNQAYNFGYVNSTDFTTSSLLDTGDGTYTVTFEEGIENGFPYIREIVTSYPYQIQNIGRLSYISKLIPNSNTIYYFEQIHNINGNLMTSTFSSIKNISSPNLSSQIDYNGNGYEIFNLNLESGTDYFGLFANLNNSKIYDLGLEILSSAITSNYGGGLVAKASTISIENCYANYVNNVEISGNYVGGLVGLISDSSNSQYGINNSFVKVNYIINSGKSIGGLVGDMSLNTSNLYLTNVYSIGSIKFSNNSTASVGGLVGNLIYNVNTLGDQVIKNSYTLMNIYPSIYSSNAKIGAVAGTVSYLTNLASFTVSTTDVNGNPTGYNLKSQVLFDQNWSLTTKIANVNRPTYYDNLKLQVLKKSLTPLLTLNPSSYNNTTNAVYNLGSLWNYSNSKYPVLNNYTNDDYVVSALNYNAIGTAIKPYIVTTEQELLTAVDLANISGSLDSRILLTSSISLTDDISNVFAFVNVDNNVISNSSYKINSLIGVLSGVRLNNNQTLVNLATNSVLFNIVLSNPFLPASNKTYYSYGFLANSLNSSILSNCSISGETNVLFYDYSNYKIRSFGGLVGSSDGNSLLFNCDVNYKLKYDIEYDSYATSIGGLVGYNEGTIYMVNNTGNFNLYYYSITSSNTTLYVGTILGQSNGTAILQNNTVKNVKYDIETKQKQFVGGIVGGNSGGSIYIENSNLSLNEDYNNSLTYDSKLEGSGDMAFGGIIGYVAGSNSQIIASTYNIPLTINFNLSTASTNIYVGGIVGYGQSVSLNSISIENSYSMLTFNNKGNGSYSTICYVGGVSGMLNGSTINNLVIGRIQTDKVQTGYNDNVNTVADVRAVVAKTTNTNIYDLSYVGGLVGYSQNLSSIINVKVYNRVIALSNATQASMLTNGNNISLFVGGLVGGATGNVPTQTVVRGLAAIRARSTTSAETRAGASFGFLTNNFTSDVSYANSSNLFPYSCESTIDVNNIFSTTSYLSKVCLYDQQQYATAWDINYGLYASNNSGDKSADTKYIYPNLYFYSYWAQTYIVS